MQVLRNKKKLKLHQKNRPKLTNNKQNKIIKKTKTSPFFIV